MVRLNSLPEAMRERLEELDCPPSDKKPWVRGGPLGERRVAMVSSAGIHRRDDTYFVGGDGGYRAIPNDVDPRDVVMTHVSVNYDRTAFQADLNAILPIADLNELAADGVIGSVATTHYSFMGATDPRDMEGDARELAATLKADGVDTVLLLPV